MLGGCGGGGGEDEAAEQPYSTGVLRDSPIAGIYYETDGKSGVTDSQGRFSYHPGDKVAFFIGRLKLGEFYPPRSDAMLTIASLVPEDATARADRLAGMARFLLTLDEDDNPANGISVPEQLDRLGLSWTFRSLDFTDFSLATNPNLYVALADMRTAKEDSGLDFVSQIDAIEHVRDSFNCAYSGAFVGTRGDSTPKAVFALVLQGDGQVDAGHVLLTGGGRHTFDSAELFDYGNLPQDGSDNISVASEESAGVSLRYGFHPMLADIVMVDLSDIPLTVPTMMASISDGMSVGIDSVSSLPSLMHRFGAKPDAALRFARIIELNGSSYVFNVEVSRDDLVRGKVIDLRTNKSATVTGSVVRSGGNFTLTANAVIGSRQLQLAGNVAGSPSALVWASTLQETIESVVQSQSTSITGCRMNPLVRSSPPVG